MLILASDGSRFTQTVSSVLDVWLWQSCGLHIHVQVHYFRSRSLVNVYFNVCVVMVVAVRAGHLDFSKKFKFMVIDSNFIQSIQLYRPNL